jgi:hypothetical protein
MVLENYDCGIDLAQHEKPVVRAVPMIGRNQRSKQRLKKLPYGTRNSTAGIVDLR